MADWTSNFDGCDGWDQLFFTDFLLMNLALKGGRKAWIPFSAKTVTILAMCLAESAEHGAS